LKKKETGHAPIPALVDEDVSEGTNYWLAVAERALANAHITALNRSAVAAIAGDIAVAEVATSPARSAYSIRS
jgi:hypothetical protein